MSLEGRVAVVTGAARGIGREAAVTLARRGAWIDPADVAPVVAFLASDEAGMVSGDSYAVTAGDSAHFTA